MPASFQMTILPVFGPISAIFYLFWRASPPSRRNYPVEGSKSFRAIHRFDSANRVSTCAVFFAIPR